jgi:hypothetical protein
MKRLWTRWAPGILLAVGLVVVGCTEQDERRSGAPREGVAQAPRDQGSPSPMTPAPSAPQEGATSPERTPPDAAKEQKPEQKQP